MEDYNQLDSTMDGQPYKAGHHAATLRRMLWREHLGLLPAQSLDASEDPNAQPPDVCANALEEGPEYEFVADPMSDALWDMWTGRATRNTDMFRHLFRADPDDSSMSSPLPSPLSPSPPPQFSPPLPPPPPHTLTRHSQNLRRLPKLPAQKQHQARPPARPLHARR